MLFGVREICDVVFRAKATQKIGNRVFYKNEPVLYFDTLKTSTLEGAATTVYAQGGRGNTRLIAWEGERTLTFTMEDALISPEGFSILSGAGLINASEEETIYVHTTAQNATGTYSDGKITITPHKDLDLTNALEKDPDGEYCFYAMIKNGDEIVSEPYFVTKSKDSWVITTTDSYTADFTADSTGLEKELDGTVNLFLDYYVARTSGAQQIEISADSFGGNYYVEASTLFRDKDGVDLPAEFIIPNCKVQSNFTFTMASTGDPSTFTFTLDAFPDETRFSKKKVLATLQIIDAEETNEYGTYRKSTHWDIAE